MKLKELLTPTLLYRTAQGVSFILVISVAIVFHVQMKSLNQSVSLISTSNKKQFELEKIISEVIQRENEMRSYIITKDSAFYDNNLITKRKIFKSLSLLKDNFSSKQDLKNIDYIDDILQKRLALFDETLAISNAQPVDTELLNSKLSEGDKQTKELQKKVYELIEQEVTKLKIHNINHRYDIETSTITAFSLTILTLVILLFSLNKINIDFEKVRKLNEELKFVNQIADNAEKVAGISHWKINMRTGKFFYSDNFYRILGLKPNAFDSKVENVIPYIHPDDIEETMKQHEESIQNHTPTSMIYRIIRKDGEIRYINSTGDFTYNSKGELVKIGVSNDITEEYNSKLALEEKNKSLIAINAELESFNQIVSHDLQEPLRKIQMFISRIEESESETISEKGKDYFTKIKNSANRMQNLMMDLVDYSKTIKNDKVFVKTSLNKLLQDVLLELAVNIEEKNATVEIGNLPRINAIPFQIHQLFVNLISNSLKYSKKDIPPVIKIKTEKIKTGETINDIEIIDKKYHKITITDNGIGFRQEFSEKIFMLFKRLETDIDYNGTGIGLAICKKITENHNGFIKAEGEPDTGATFTIYLPKVT
ncbi:ATP-binding protein [Flavobacterium microcysteis]|uniref:histidine kinase n=1 Tax=Flavobacterium microcysteis TaxID=2596891 RepID=A0A501QL00_9FLAO|nr:ATP-binding protein [Flavobacterium microcysteis]TPD73480.1 PAS domain S-box protein [Flavobacterium microcysteis]